MLNAGLMCDEAILGRGPSSEQQGTKVVEHPSSGRGSISEGSSQCQVLLFILNSYYVCVHVPVDVNCSVCVCACVRVSQYYNWLLVIWQIGADHQGREEGTISLKQSICQYSRTDFAVHSCNCA